MHIKEYIVLCLEEFKKIFSEFPKEFSWTSYNLQINNNYINYGENIIEKISKPKDQGSLGVCWAIAFATTINDAFLISGITDWNPNISVTYILSKFKNVGSCSKGSIIKLGNIAINCDIGFASESCIDSSWCYGSGNCNSENLPTEGCYTDEVEKYSYKISKIFYISWDNFYCKIGNINKTLEYFIKSHILLKSPVIFGFPIFKNFLTNFWNDSNNNGVYFEDSSENPVLFHAACVVGWGYTKIKSRSKHEILYWIIRNSWGEKWGENGYCKIAAWPFNKYCAPNNVIKYKKQFSPYLVFINVDNFPETKKYNKSVFKEKNFNLLNHYNYYIFPEKNIINNPYLQKNCSLKKCGKYLDYFI